jgi:polyisoprenyl-phosphate glycosyltransferase
MNKTICIISSFFNEEHNLEKHLKCLENFRKKSLKNYNIKLVLVNDGSTDNSSKLLKKLVKNKKYIEIINLTKNFGQQIAIYAALKKYKADYYGVIDSDGQQDPLLFLRMIKMLKEKKVEIIQMQKKYGQYEGYLKQFISRMFYALFAYLTNIDLKPGSSDFYLFTKNVQKEIAVSETSKYFLRGFIHSLGLKKCYIKYDPSKRENGVSKYSIDKQLDFALTAIYLYGTKIFTQIFIFSFILIFISFIFIIYSIYEHYVHDVQAPGWASIIILVTFFGAINVFFITLVTFFSIKFGSVMSKKVNYIVK